MRALVFLAAVGLDMSQADSARDVAQLIEQLRSDRIEERENAAQKLKDLGTKAVVALEKAARDGEPDLQARSKHLLAVIHIRTKLSARLMQTFPGIEERLAVSNAQDWTHAFLEASSAVDGRPRHSTLRRDDLDRLLDDSFQGATSTKEKRDLCKAIAFWHLTRGPEVATKYLRDPDGPVRAAAATSLGYLGDKTRAADLVSFLKDADESVQTESYWALAKLRSNTTWPQLRKLLVDENSEVRRKATSLLGILWDRESIPELVRLLSDDAPFIRINAALGLAGMQVKEQIPAIAALLQDKESGVRGMAIEALTGMNAQDFIPKIADCLSDTDGVVRCHAVMCLGDLAAVDKADQVALRVKDDLELVKKEALRALARFRSMKHRSLIMAALEDPEEMVRVAAIDALEWGDAQEVVAHLRPLLKDPSSFVSRSAAHMLCRLGVTDGVPLLLEKGTDLLECMNVLRQPQECAALARPLDRDYSGTCLEIIEQITRRLGLRLDLAALTPADYDTWLADEATVSVGRRNVTYENGIFMVLWTHADWILEGNVLRVLPRDDAIRYWREWWKKIENK